MQVHIGRICCV